MDIKSSSKSKVIDSENEQKMEKNGIQFLIEHWESRIKQIQKRISQKEVRLESMESHSDYDYKNLLKESNEAEKDHKKDLKLLIDLLCKYNIVNK
jgi:hypothetical protein